MPEEKKEEKKAEPQLMPVADPKKNDEFVLGQKDTQIFGVTKEDKDFLDAAKRFEKFMMMENEIERYRNMANDAHIRDLVWRIWTCSYNANQRAKAFRGE